MSSTVETALAISPQVDSDAPSAELVTVPLDVAVGVDPDQAHGRHGAERRPRR